jgi:hypothetical protein
MTTIPLLEAPWLDGGKWKDIASYKKRWSVKSAMQNEVWIGIE